MSYFIAVLFLLLIGYVVFRLGEQQPTSLKLFFWSALSVKLLAGIALGLVYMYYYEVGDTFGFFTDAIKLNDLAAYNSANYMHFLLVGNKSLAVANDLVNSQQRSLFLVKIISLVSLVSASNYWLTSIYFSLMSFLGSWYLVRKIHNYGGQGINAALIAFLFFPSVVFWSSGITKESLAMASLFFLAGFCLSVRMGEIKFWEWMLLVIGTYFLWSLKYYWLALFVPSSVACLAVYSISRNRTKAVSFTSEVLTWLAVFVFLCLSVSILHPNFYLSRLLNVIVENYNTYIALSDERMMVHLSNLQPTWFSVILNSPWALFSGLFRPFISEATTLFQWEIAIENVVLLGLSGYNLRYVSTIRKSANRIFILGILMYVIFLCVFLTLSTPNLGTLSRYRVGFLPFYLFLLFFYPMKAFNQKTLN